MLSTETLLGTAAAFVAAAALTGAARRYALARSVLDIPNARSSHTGPTPRGGGIAIAVVALCGALLAGVSGSAPPRAVAALAGAGLLVAFVGWVDDHREVRARVRALVHLVAAVWALAWLGGLPALRLGGSEAQLGLGGWVIGALGIVWLTNLYNFMDGIDGIAAGEAVTGGLFAAILLAAHGAPGLALLSLLVAAASAGFLVWNWAPARIFMGDVGSGLLGAVFAVLAVASENAGAVPLLAWVLLFGTFVFDATVTLARRVVRGERWYAAHRSHAYQRAVQAGFGHGQVTAAVLLLNVLLAGLAAVASARPAFLLPALGAGAALLAAVYLWVERRRPMARERAARPAPLSPDGTEARQPASHSSARLPQGG